MNWRKKLYRAVKPKLEKLDQSHQIEHSLRVFDYCEQIAKGAGPIDYDSLYAAALLHDIGQTITSLNEHSRDSITISESMLAECGFPPEKIVRVAEIIREHDNYRWVKGHRKAKPKSAEARIFQDADRIESFGAIGIARQFLFASKHGKKMWDPRKKPQPQTIYGGNISAIHTIRDHQLAAYKHLNTSAAKKIAKSRNEFTKKFLSQFLKEWK